MDRTELRENIEQLITATDTTTASKIDQILAHIDPEQIRKEERERIFRWVDEYLQPRYSPHDHHMYFKNVAEVTWRNFWQARSQEEK